jgi:hypothetical protein
MAGPAKLNNENIPYRDFALSDLIFGADPDTGLGGKNTIEYIAALLAGGTGTLTITEVDTSASPITLNMQNVKQKMFYSSDVIAGNRVIVISNQTGSLELKSWKFEVDAADREFTFPANVAFVPGTAGWEVDTDQVWKSFAAGKYEISGTYDEVANEWLLKLIGNY